MMNKIKDIEQVYVEDIHPLIERIALVCFQNNIPLFLSCQDGDSSFRNTLINNKNQKIDKFRLHSFVAENRSLDDILLAIIEDAKKNGHNSKILRAMGIPMNQN
ncbi:hypothetical protein F0M16_08610 [Vibrio cholerae]|uniref:Uncharacterized protein n=1 Tax=Vibrio cholerae TaxID=666 RepID=A0A5Q6PK54_VIBCL|nr:hypothetical protein F0M16_08610 [Vibrio cholerae]